MESEKVVGLGEMLGLRPQRPLPTVRDASLVALTRRPLPTVRERAPLTGTQRVGDPIAH